MHTGAHRLFQTDLGHLCPRACKAECGALSLLIGTEAAVIRQAITSSTQYVRCYPPISLSTSLDLLRVDKTYDQYAGSG
jgi:hypothetical protein